jgi:hypothetical protein
MYQTNTADYGSIDEELDKVTDNMRHYSTPFH